MVNKILKKQETILKVDKKLDRKMKMTSMWLGWIMGFVTIALVGSVITYEFMTATPNLLIIVIDLFAFFMSINLIYQSFKTRHELRNQVQKELLEELERD